jgi:hypothetical protein
MSIQEPSHDGAVVVEIPRDPGCGVRARRLVRDYLGRDVD